MTASGSSTSIGPQPFFLPGPEGYPGHRFCLFHRPVGEAPKGWVVYVHPFAEEMNKSRRMAALQSRALADAGFAVLQIDLFGCGDSSGDFSDATWEAWIADVCHGARWLLQQGPAAPLWFLGLRAGCLIAAGAAARLDLACNFLFWQPSAMGRSMLQQFLRLKLAGGLLDGQAKGTMEELKQRLASGLPVDVAGYRLTAELANGMADATLAAPPLHGRMEWFELSSHAARKASNGDANGSKASGPEMMPASRPILERWRQAAWSVHGRCVEGPAFWQATEIEDAPELVTATISAITAITADNDAAMTNRSASAFQAATLADNWAHAEKESAAALRIPCAGETMVGVLRAPPQGARVSDVAVVVIVGGPQYRVGSHRHFVLLSRQLAAAGHPVLCFDYRGMGDSSGAQRDFQSVDTDVAAAIDHLQSAVPGVKRIVLWGLCDGASAALLYLFSTQDPRVAALCLLNPWVRSESSLALTHVKHYYLARIRDAEFWHKLLRGRVAWAAARGLWQNLGMAAEAAGSHSDETGDPRGSLQYQAKMLLAWTQFRGPSLLVLSGRDYTAKEFMDHAASRPHWQRVVAAPGVRRESFAAADHTFSDFADAQGVTRLTLAWLKDAVELQRKTALVQPTSALQTAAR